MKQLIPIFILLLSAATSFAQEVPDLPDRPKVGRKIQATVNNAVLRPRNRVPIPVEITLDYMDKKLLRGVVRLELRNGQERVGEVQSPQVVLNEGKNVVRLALPPLEVFSREQQVDAILSFVTEETTYPLDMHLITAPTVGDRTLVIAVCESWQRSAGGTHAVAQMLGLEKFDSSVRQPTEPQLTTFTQPVDPERFGEQPMDYCIYDAVFLPPEGFAQLSARQLEALGAWVKAGGSLCVMNGGGLAAHHVAFLKSLAEGRDDLGFVLDDRGRVIAVSDAPLTGQLLLRPGLGRAVILLNPVSETEFQSAEWRSTAAFFWKVREQQLPFILRTGKWSIDLQAKRSGYEDQLAAQYEQQFGRRLYYRASAMPGSSQLVSELMPKSVQVIPFWMIVAILVLFALAVGPGDYMLLGLIRQRKLTWILFPATAVAFTLVTVAIADSYMGKTDHRRALVIGDVDSQGNLLRQSRLELIFVAKQRTLEEQQKGAYYVPIKSSWLYQNQYDPFTGAMPSPYGGDSLTREEPSVIEGRMPQNYVLRHPVYQWTPQMVRKTRIFMPADEQAKAPMKIDWDAPNRIPIDKLTEKDMIGDEGFNGSVVVFHQDRTILLGNRSLEILKNEKPDERYSQYGSYVMDKGALRQAHQGVVLNLTVRRNIGFFSIVSMISPDGSDTFEDLALLDGSDPDSFVVAVVVPQGQDIVVYRKLYKRPRPVVTE